ncbi:MAG: hypothetical protein MHM6MM_001532 [Cercozoa sp. M6MM]
MRPHGAFNESDWHLTLSVWPHARVSPFPPSAETALYSSSAFSPRENSTSLFSKAKATLADVCAAFIWMELLSQWALSKPVVRNSDSDQHL